MILRQPRSTRTYTLFPYTRRVLSTWMGFVYGPRGAWLPGLFPARVRYTGASMAFNVGGILGGALAPMIAQALADRGGLAPVGLYLSAAGLDRKSTRLNSRH